MMNGSVVKWKATLSLSLSLSLTLLLSLSPLVIFSLYLCVMAEALFPWSLFTFTTLYSSILFTTNVLCILFSFSLSLFLLLSFSTAEQSCLLEGSSKAIFLYLSLCTNFYYSGLMNHTSASPYSFYLSMLVYFSFFVFPWPKSLNSTALISLSTSSPPLLANFSISITNTFMQIWKIDFELRT